MTKESESVAEDPQNNADAAAVSAATDYLTVRAQKISDLIKLIDEANQTPGELLDIESGLGEQGGDTGTQAEYFFIIARECRNRIREISEFLHEIGWSDTSELILAQTFVELTDTWGTYKVILGTLSDARWGERPSTHDVLMGLQKPRRNFINALKVYHQQLDTVLGCVRRYDEAQANQ